MIKKIMDSKPKANIWQFELTPNEMAAVLSQWMMDVAQSMEDKPVTYFKNLSVRLERTDDGIWAFRREDGGIWTSDEYTEIKRKKLEQEKKERKESIRLTKEAREELEREKFEALDGEKKEND